MRKPLCFALAVYSHQSAFRLTRETLRQNIEKEWTEPLSEASPEVS